MNGIDLKMILKRSTLIPLAVAWSLSVAYIFSVGVDWAWTLKNGTVMEAVFTCAILSMWAAAPYLVLISITWRESRLNVVLQLAVMAILAFGYFAMSKARHTPGDEGGSFIVVPAQQMVIAALIVVVSSAVRRLHNKITS